MQSRDGRRIIKEILAVRRNLRFRRPGTELFSRLGDIERTYQRFNPELKELLRYFPIALVACIESYFRLMIKELIDSGEPYLTNSRNILRKEKYDFDILKGLHGQTITIGDVISHHLSISDLNHIIGAMGPIMDCDFPERLSHVYDRREVKIKKNPMQPIIQDRHETFRYVERSFQLRHIFCHEIATAIEIEKDEIDNCVYHTVIFLKASDELISQTLFPNAPLTQTDMNIASYEDHKREKGELDCLLAKLDDILSDKQKEKFRDANEAWNTFVNASVEIEGLQYEGGTIRPMIESHAATQLLKERKEQIKELLTYLNQP